MKTKFNKTYFALTIILFLIEVIIGKYVEDSIIRPYGGDVLVVILMYCFIKSFWDFPIKQTAIGVLLFAYIIETLQHFKLVNILGLGDYKIARIVIGTDFAWSDLVAYTLGFFLIIVFEKYRPNKFISK